MHTAYIPRRKSSREARETDYSQKTSQNTEHITEQNRTHLVSSRRMTRRGESDWQGIGEGKRKSGMWSIQDHHEEPYSSCLVNPCGCLPSAYNCNSLTNEPSSSSPSTSSSLLSSNSTTTPSVNPLLLKRQQRQEHSSESQGISLKRFPSTTMRMLQGMSKKVHNYRPDAVTHVNSKTTPISGKKTTMIPSFKDKPVVMNHSASPTLFDCQSHILPLHAHQNVLSCNSLHQFSLLRYFLMLSILIILPVCANASSLLHQHQHSGGSALSSVSLFSLYESESLSPRTVHTKYGALRGVLVHYKAPDLSRTAPKGSSSSAGGVSSSHVTKTVEVFLGVPYATPPVGSLRFMPPVTPTHWPGVKMAKRFSPICPQKIPEALRHHRMVDLSGSSNGNSSRSHVSSSSSSSVTRGASNSPKPSFNFTPNSYGSLSSPTSSSHSISSSMSSSSDSKVGHLKRMASIVRNQSEDCLYLNIYAPYTSPPSTTSSQHSSSVSSSPSVQSSSSSSSSSSVSASTSSSSSLSSSSTSSQSKWLFYFNNRPLCQFNSTFSRYFCPSLMSALLHSYLSPFSISFSFGVMFVSLRTIFNYGRSFVITLESLLLSREWLAKCWLIIHEVDEG